MCVAVIDSPGWCTLSDLVRELAAYPMLRLYNYKPAPAMGWGFKAGKTVNRSANSTKWKLFPGILPNTLNQNKKVILP